MEIPFQGSANEIYTKLKNSIEAQRAQGRLSILEEVNYKDSSNQAIAKGSGFEALIVCVDGLVKVDLKLTFLLKPIRSKIEETLKKKLTDAMVRSTEKQSDNKTEA